ncbi:seminal metalloprotease 1-like [Calliphora vicina]|uniref:seminal metalloprotease 1-like n=1 Tax=Calliphora vicina TaxID=7373 RepID=UPI00325B778E
MKNILLLVTLFLILVNCHSVPVESERVEDDPELIAGLFEGDMELDLSRNGLVDTSKRWPNGIVRYKIGPAFDMDHSIYILQGMQIIESVSCIRFRHATATTKAYIQITGQSTGCSARVGYSGVIQNLNLRIDALDKGCFRIGTIMHELLHALGFHHQQNSSDRDEYVKIAWDNITEDKKYNFNKYNSNTVTDFGVVYDYGSVMHYGPIAFSKNGEKTIVPLKESNAVMGQRLELSDTDIKKLNKMYNC